MARDIVMTICKGIVVSFLPCLIAFWGFHPYMFFECFLLLVCAVVVVFWGGGGGREKGMDSCVDGTNPVRY